MKRSEGSRAALRASNGAPANDNALPLAVVDEALARELAAALVPVLRIVRRILGAEHGAGASAPVAPYYDQASAPVSKRVFLTAARAGEFESFACGKRVFARRADVHAWIERGRRPSVVALDASDNDVVATALARVGAR